MPKDEAAGVAIREFLPAGCAGAQAPGTTPRQTTGPFYPTDWSGDADADLPRVIGEAAQAQGIVTHLRGALRAVDGTALAGARMEPGAWLAERDVILG